MNYSIEDCIGALNLGIIRGTSDMVIVLDKEVAMNIVTYLEDLKVMCDVGTEKE